MPSLEKKLKPKAKNIETSPSLISQNYVHAVFRCVCCGRKFGDVDYRQEDMVKMLKFDAPLCKKCAKFLKGWQQKFESKLGKVAQQIRENAKTAYELCYHIPQNLQEKWVRLDSVLGLLVESGTLETLAIMKDKKLMKLLRDSRKKGSKSSPYKPLVELSKVRSTRQVEGEK